VFRLVAKRQFGVSTHLYHRQRLCRAHLLEIAAYGFEQVEVVATQAHFDYHSPTAIADLQQWIAEAGLSLAAIHAPFGAASDEVERVLFVARRIPVPVLVVHVEGPRKAERRRLARFAELAAPLGVRVAVEAGDNAASKTGPLTYFVEHDLEDVDIGICLDFGRAHLDGDLVDAIETSAEHLVAVHAHDNRGRSDDHLVPFDGTIDWPAAMTTVQKVGYEGPIVFEVAPRGPARELLDRMRTARGRLEKLFAN
jgi:sugar phosphate isomerase/epimerase